MEPHRAAAFAHNIALITRVNKEHDAGRSTVRCTPSPCPAHLPTVASDYLRGGRGLLPQVRLGVNPFSDLTNEMFRRRNTHA